MLAVGGLPVFNVVVVKFYINCMVAINRCMIVLVLILIYTSLTVNYSYLRIIRLTMHFTLYNYGYPIPRHKLSTIGDLCCTTILNNILDLNSVASTVHLFHGKTKFKVVSNRRA